MALDLVAIVRRLQEVEARYPDAAADLDPVIQALTGDDLSMIDVEQARQLLGAPSVNTVEAWITLGILPGTQDAQTGQWVVPLSAVLRFRDFQEGISAFGGEDMSQEELDILSETRFGTFPWQRGERDQSQVVASSPHS